MRHHDRLNNRPSRLRLHRMAHQPHHALHHIHNHTFLAASRYYHSNFWRLILHLFQQTPTQSAGK